MGYNSSEMVGAQVTEHFQMEKGRVAGRGAPICFVIPMPLVIFIGMLR
jgi:hypothetical protein